MYQAFITIVWCRTGFTSSCTTLMYATPTHLACKGTNIWYWKALAAPRILLPVVMMARVVRMGKVVVKESVVKNLWWRGCSGEFVGTSVLVKTLLWVCCECYGDTGSMCGYVTWLHAEEIKTFGAMSFRRWSDLGWTDEECVKEWWV